MCVLQREQSQEEITAQYEDTSGDASIWSDRQVRLAVGHLVGHMASLSRIKSLLLLAFIVAERGRQEARRTSLSQLPDSKITK